MFQISFLPAYQQKQEEEELKITNNFHPTNHVYFLNHGWGGCSMYRWESFLLALIPLISKVAIAGNHSAFVGP